MCFFIILLFFSFLEKEQRQIMSCFFIVIINYILHIFFFPYKIKRIEINS